MERTSYLEVEAIRRDTLVSIADKSFPPPEHLSKDVWSKIRSTVRGLSAHLGDASALKSRLAQFLEDVEDDPGAIPPDGSISGFTQLSALHKVLDWPIFRTNPDASDIVNLLKERVLI